MENIFHSFFIPCILNRYAKFYIFIAKKFIFYSYRMKQTMMIPFQSMGLSNDFRIHERIVYALDIHRKGMESVFNQNITIIIFNYNDI